MSRPESQVTVGPSSAIAAQQPSPLLPIDIALLIHHCCREKQASQLAIGAHDASSRTKLLKARNLLYAFAPHLEPPSYAKADNDDSSAANAVQAIVKLVEPAQRLNDPVPTLFEAPATSAPRNIAMADLAEFDRSRATRVSAEMLAGAYLDVERAIVVEYAAVCRRYGHLVDGHRKLSSTLDKVRHVYHGALDGGSGLTELMAQCTHDLERERKRLRSIAAATGLAIVGGHASGFERLRKFSDVTYFDYQAGAVVQFWPCRMLCNAHIGALNELVNVCGSSLFAPMTVAVDVLGRCFTASWLVPLQFADSVCQLPLRSPMVKFQLERACWESNYFFTNSNQSATDASTGEAKSIAGAALSPCFDDFYLRTNAVVLFGCDARMHVVAGRGLLPLFHLRHLRQASSSSPSRGLAAMLHYFGDTFSAMDSKALAAQVKAEGRARLLDDDAEGLATMEREVLLFSSSQLAKAKREKAAAARGMTLPADDDLNASLSSSGLSSGLRFVLGTAVSILDAALEDVIARSASQPGAPGPIVVDVMHRHGMPLKYLPYLYQRLCEKHAARVAIDSDPVYCALAQNKDSPMSTIENDLRMLNDGIRAVVTEMFARVLKHLVMQAWRRQFARREDVGSKPPIATLCRVVDKILLMVFPMPMEHTQVVFVPFHQRNMSDTVKAMLVEGIFGILSKPPRSSNLTWDLLHISPLHIVARLCALCDLTFANGKVMECAPHVINFVDLRVPERVRMAVTGRQRFILTGLMEQLRFARKYTPSLLHHLTLSLVDYYAQVSTSVIAGVSSRPGTAQSLKDDASAATSTAVVNLDELLSLVKMPKRHRALSEGDDENDEEALLLQSAIQERRVDLLIGAEVARSHPEFGDDFFEACRSSLIHFTECMVKAAKNGAESTYALVVARRVSSTCRAIVHIERQRATQLHAQVADANLTTSMAQHSKRKGLQESASKNPTPALAARKSAWGEDDGGNATPLPPANLQLVDAGGALEAKARRKRVFIEAVSDKTIAHLTAFVDQAIDAVQRTADKKKLHPAHAAWLYEAIFQAQLCLRMRFDVDGLQSHGGNAIEIAQLKHSFYASVFGEKSVEAMSALVDVATAKAQSRDFQGALEAYDAALQELDRVKHPQRFAPANNMAYIHFAVAEQLTPAALKVASCKNVRLPAEAEEHLRKAESILDMLVDARQRQDDALHHAEVVIDDLLMSDVYNNIGAVANFRRKYAVAIAAFDKSLRYSAGKLAESHPDRALAVRNIRVCRRRQMDNALYFLTLWARRFRARRLVRRLKQLRAVALRLQPFGRGYMNRHLLGRLLLYRYGGVKHTVVNAAKLLQRVGRGAYHRHLMSRARALQLKRDGKIRRHFALKREDTTGEAAAAVKPVAEVVTTTPEADPHAPTLTVASLNQHQEHLTHAVEAVPEPSTKRWTTADPAAETADPLALAKEVRRRRHNYDQTAAIQLPQWTAPKPAASPRVVATEVGPRVNETDDATRRVGQDKPQHAAPLPSKDGPTTLTPKVAPKAHEGETYVTPPPPEASPVRSKDPVADEAITAYYRQRLLALYAFYGLPKKIPAIDKNLAKYSGDEKNFIQALTEKYGPEPPKERRAELVAKAYEMCPTARPQALVLHGARPEPLSLDLHKSFNGKEEGATTPAPPSRGSSRNRAPRSERSRARRSSGHEVAGDDDQDAEVTLNQSRGSSNGRRVRSSSRGEQKLRSDEKPTLIVAHNTALDPTAAKTISSILTPTDANATPSVDTRADRVRKAATTLQKAGRGLSVRLTLFKLMTVRRSMQKHLEAMTSNRKSNNGLRAAAAKPPRRSAANSHNTTPQVSLDEL